MMAGDEFVHLVDPLQGVLLADVREMVGPKGAQLVGVERVLVREAVADLPGSVTETVTPICLRYASISAEFLRCCCS